jgi:hypothetical protein
MNAKRLITVFVACCCVGLLTAMSPPPAPTKPVQEPQDARPAERNKADGDRGSPQPPPASMNLPVPPKTQVESANASAGEGSDAATNRWIALFTGVLAIVAILQWVAMIQQARHAKASNRLGERALILGRRSWAIVAGGNAPIFLGVQRVTVDITLENLSDMPAVVTRYGGSVLIGELPKDVVVRPEQWRRSGQVVVRGRLISLETLEVRAFSPDELIQAQKDMTPVHFLCVVEYTDCFEKVWRTTACWRYNWIEEKWEAAPDYNILK